MRIPEIMAVVLLLTLPVVELFAQTGRCSEVYLEPSLYHPDGLFVWDTWFLQDGDTTHVFHLQVKRPDKNVDENFKEQRERIANYDDQTDKATFEGTIGHATSKDLLAWTQQPTALFRTDAAKVGGPGNAYDDGVLFTGCAVKHEGIYYLFYAGNTRRYVQGNRRGMQTICLATSTDGIHYKRHPKNPLFAPDPNRYYTYPEPPAPFKHHARRGTDCRDILVVKDPSSKGWLGYVVMRRKGFNDAFHSACIVLCRSENLVDWEVGDPVCTPNRFARPTDSTASKCRTFFRSGRNGICLPLRVMFMASPTDGPTKTSLGELLFSRPILPTVHS
jgi:beta-fructofuranosidase